MVAIILTAIESWHHSALSDVAGDGVLTLQRERLLDSNTLWPTNQVKVPGVRFGSDVLNMKVHKHILPAHVTIIVCCCFGLSWSTWCVWSRMGKINLLRPASHCSTKHVTPVKELWKSRIFVSWWFLEKGQQLPSVTCSSVRLVSAFICLHYWIFAMISWPGCSTSTLAPLLSVLLHSCSSGLWLSLLEYHAVAVSLPVSISRPEPHNTVRFRSSLFNIRSFYRPSWSCPIQTSHHKFGDSPFMRMITKPTSLAVWSQKSRHWK